ncbi:NAD-dependent epimerase/dehydratase family protein [Algoriphagus lutimaris]|uniref:NAD-dependent epimerase/dehydratase family protein n=1 Tax=Algoriphagus lutimaris TaxID=613197 RepID=UPI00196AF3D4|nr:NAD-dependent epimerase/dehydratase family protein [Algoriphagus lutimaris]MBN3518700.1 NAD-dependent epimerase/dehydratase family protein [Algoriphagus lutimaris]
MRVLLTGGSGFLGSYIYKALANNHDVITLGRSGKNTLQADFNKELPALPNVDWVIHAASPAHFIPKTESEKQSFFDINVSGTEKLLKGLTKLPKIFVFISTVAVYGLEEGEMIKESASLNADTPYGKSKAEAEILIQNWAKVNGVKAFIFRLPLVVGKNPPGNLSAIAKSIKKKMYFRIGKGLNKKSMVLAEDVANLISQLETKPSGIYHLCDPQPASLSEIDASIAAQFGYKVKTIPDLPITLAAKIGDLLPFFPLNTLKVKKLSSTLTFDTKKAINELNWKPNSVLGFLKNTSIIS